MGSHATKSLLLLCCAAYACRYLLERSIWPHALVALVTFSTGFAVLTELPGALAHAPYSMPAALVGVSV